LWFSERSFVTGRVHDASVQGMRVHVDRLPPSVLKPGERCRLEILPRVGDPRTLDVEVRHVSRYVVGVKLVDGRSVASGAESAPPSDLLHLVQDDRLGDVSARPGSGTVLGSGSLLQTGAAVEGPRRSVVRFPLRKSVPASSTAPVHMHFPLNDARLCSDCDRVFRKNYPTCPACGSEHWVPLATLLDRTARR
jgi:hypothetical protein